MSKTKSRKIDRKLVAADEVQFISTRHKVKVSDVRLAKKNAGVSRVKIYAALRLMGYKIKTRKFPNG